MDPAPAFEESPDLVSALSILHSTVLCGVVRLNQLHVIVRWQANAQIHGQPQTEPSPQGPLPGQRANAIVITSRVVSFRHVCLCVDYHAASLGEAGVCSLRSRGGGPPSVYASR